MAKSNLNNALNDWFSEDKKPEVDTKTIPVKLTPTSGKDYKAEKNPKESNKQESKISRNIETKNNRIQDDKIPLNRVKFGTMIRADLLKKLKVKSVQEDKSIYELIEDAIEKMVS